MTINSRMKLAIPLIIISLVAIALNTYYNFDGLFINIGTEVIGIIVTIVYVDIIIERHEKRNWNVVSRKMTEELCVTSNVIINSMRTALGLSLDTMIFPDNMYSIYQLPINEQAVLISDRYRKNVSPTLQQKVVDMAESDWKTLMINLGNVHNACINYQSMYNSIASPIQIETLMNITSLTFSITNLYQTFGDIFSEEDQVLRKQTGNDERVELKYWLNRKFCEDFNKLVSILYTEIQRNQ